MLVISRLYDIKVKHNLLCQINKLHLVQLKIFSLMQEITLYFLLTMNKTGYFSCFLLFGQKEFFEVGYNNNFTWLHLNLPVIIQPKY